MGRPALKRAEPKLKKSVRNLIAESADKLRKLRGAAAIVYAAAQLGAAVHALCVPCNMLAHIGKCAVPVSGNVFRNMPKRSVKPCAGGRGNVIFSAARRGFPQKGRDFPVRPLRP